MAKIFPLKYTCDNCATPVYKVTKKCNAEKKWCSNCAQGKKPPTYSLVGKGFHEATIVPQKRTERGLGEDFTSNLEESLPSDKTVPFAEFNPLVSAEKDVKYYLSILHRVEFLLLENYKTPEKCHFTKLWDQAKGALK